MSNGKRLALAGIAFVILQLGVLLMVLFFLAVQPHRGPELIHWLSLLGGFLLWGIAFWLLGRALSTKQASGR